MTASVLIGVVTTGVVCRPGCPGRPHLRNVVVLDDLDAARAAGLRPCLRCRPDRFAADGSEPHRFGVRRPFDAGALLAFLAARAIPGVETVQGHRYERRVRVAHGVAHVRLDVHERGVDALLDADPRDVPELLDRVRRLLDLDADSPAIDAALSADPLLRPLVAARPGLRSPGALDEPEVLVRAIVGQQVSVAAARTVLGRISAAHGDEACFPAPDVLAEIDPATLPMPAARARSLIAAMDAVADDPAVLHDRERLTALPGVGAWTAGYVALRLGDRDAFLPTDLVARRAMAAWGDVDPVRWSPYRAYALHHLWRGQTL